MAGDATMTNSGERTRARVLVIAPSRSRTFSGGNKGRMFRRGRDQPAPAAFAKATASQGGGVRSPIHNPLRRDDVTLQRITRGEASRRPEGDHFLFPAGCGLALLRHEVFLDKFNGALDQLPAGTQAELAFDVFAVGLDRFDAQL
jgi:hypothetical protein